MNTAIHRLALTCLVALTVLPAREQPVKPATLAFRPGTNGGFAFDTGELRGVLRANGKSTGLQQVTHVATGQRLDASMGWFSHYRVFTTGKRYGAGAWDWPGTAVLTDRGAVEVSWPATEERPFELRAVYRWAAPTTLDLMTTVTARQDLSKFESFLASYFTAGFTNALAVAGGGPGKPGAPAYLPAARSAGDWQMFPRDEAAVRVIEDGRWQLLPHPVDWTIRPRFRQPVAIRTAAASHLAVILMARRDECFAVAMPYETEGHYSAYLSLFGRDLKAGETARAQARLCVVSGADQETLTRTWAEYTGAGSKP